MNKSPEYDATLFKQLSGTSLQSCGQALQALMPMSLHRVHSHIILPNLLEATVGDSGGAKLRCVQEFYVRSSACFAGFFAKNRVQDVVFCGQFVAECWWMMVS
jgi:hypothetical protein